MIDLNETLPIITLDVNDLNTTSNCRDYWIGVFKKRTRLNYILSRRNTLYTYRHRSQVK